MPNEFQSLRLATRKRVERLTEPQIPEANFFKHHERLGKSLRFTDLREEPDCFADRDFQQIVNRFAVQQHFEHMRLKTGAVAFRATDVEIAKELHLDLFKTGPRATFATPA